MESNSLERDFRSYKGRESGQGKKSVWRRIGHTRPRPKDGITSTICTHDVIYDRDVVGVGDLKETVKSRVPGGHTKVRVSGRRGHHTVIYK